MLVLGMVAKGMDACDRQYVVQRRKNTANTMFWAWSRKAWTFARTCIVPHPLRNVLYKEATTQKNQCLRADAICMTFLSPLETKKTQGDLCARHQLQSSVICL